MLQAATDALYVQLVADLKAAGIEVVAVEEVAAHAAMADLRKAARPSPAAVNDSSIKKLSTLVSAQNLPLVLASLPNARFVEAGTVFSFAQGGQQSVLGLQKPVPITGLKVTTDIDRLELKKSTFGSDTRTARSGGLVGLLARGAGADSESADFWVSFDAAELQPALVSAGSTIFKELAQILSAPK